MSDLLKGLTSGGWGGFFAWIAPIVIVLSGFWWAVYLQLSHPPFYSTLGYLSASETCILLLVIATSLGVVASACSMPLYRILEGYLLWPSKLADRRAKRHCALKQTLQQKIDQTADGWQRNLYQEKLLRYPFEESQIIPTRFGNAIRAFETYGSTRFGLDSGTLWSELIAAVPESLQKDLDTSRAIVDFFVCGFFSLIVFAVAAVAIGIFDGTYIYPISFAFVCLIGAAGSYEMAISSCSYWGATNRALINSGRYPLAKALGLKLPATLAEEMDMWKNVTSYVYYRDYPSGDAFNRYRNVEKPE